ncbi:acyl carrier protein, partial [Amycolatopsis sp. SID8362]|uniref:acyl carrier protein n=1 Tax=Amycolatopsis sp. SID8362 TaxID=2690346 RepID=UPI001369BA2A
PLFRGLIRGARRPSAAPEEGALAARLAEVPAEEQEAVLLDLVRTQVAAVLGHASADAVDPERGFGDFGFDSLSAVELRNNLAAATGLRLPATLIFDYPDPRVLTGFLLAELGRGDAEAADPALTALAQLEAGLAAGEPAEATRMALRTRLEVLLATLYPRTGAEEGERLDTATDEELFALIDQDFEVR